MTVKVWTTRGSDPIIHHNVKFTDESDAFFIVEMEPGVMGSVTHRYLLKRIIRVVEEA